MGAERALLLIDTNVFVIDLRYQQDTHYKTNRLFTPAEYLQAIRPRS